MEPGVPRRRLLIVWSSVAVLAAAVVGLTAATLVYVHPQPYEERSRVLRVHGRVTGLKSVADLPLVLMSPNSKAVQMRTGPDGAFSGAVSAPGVYALELRLSEFLTSTRRQCAVLEDNAECNLSLPDTRVDLSTRRSDGTFGSVGVYIEGPVSPTDSRMMGFVTGASSQSISLVGTGYGTYSVTFYTKEGHTSATPAEFTLSPEQPYAARDIELVVRRLRLRVLDKMSNPVPGATVRGAMRQVAESAGEFNADAIPAGTALQVTAPGYLPTCVRAASTQSQQLIILERTAPNSRTYITLKPSPAKPAGVIDGMVGSECAVDVTAFRLDQSRISSRGTLEFGIIGLPAGAYRYRVSPIAPWAEVRVPGEPLEYAVPPACLICM